MPVIGPRGDKKLIVFAVLFMLYILSDIIRNVDKQNNKHVCMWQNRLGMQLGIFRND